jgi:hypothetical protein
MLSYSRALQRADDNRKTLLLIFYSWAFGRAKTKQQNTPLFMPMCRLFGVE